MYLASGILGSAEITWHNHRLIEHAPTNVRQVKQIATARSKNLTHPLLPSKYSERGNLLDEDDTKVVSEAEKCRSLGQGKHPLGLEG
eukprot:SAG11_NODE_4046_length_2088_cov_1.206134_3_plen_87_part_00